MEAPHTRTRLLLVEDSPTAVLLVRTLLEDAIDGAAHGDAAGGAFPFISLTHADCLAAALDLLGWESFDLILLDLTLPDSQGLDTLTKVHECAPHVPIVVLTAISDESLGIRALQAGAQDYLIKDETYRKLLRRSILHAIERKRVEDALRQAKVTAEAKTQDRTLWLADLGGEAGHALTATLEASDRLEQVLAHSPMAAGGAALAALHDIRASTRGLMRTLDHLRDLAQLDAGELKLRLDRISVNRLIRDAVAEIHHMADDGGVALKLDVGLDLPEIGGDAVRLMQALVQLLHNALQFTQPGGEVLVRAVRNGGEVVIAVQDSGCGFRREELPYLLHPFGRHRRGGHRHGEGAGLGLPLAAAVLEAHAGRLELSNGDDGGAIIRMHLPVVRKAAVQGE